MSEPIAIASYDYLPPAQALVRELSARGFEAGVQNETAEQALKFFAGHAHAQFRVTVPPDKMTQALEEFARIPPLPAEQAEVCPVAQVIRCPDCGSTRVEFPQFSRHTIVGALPAIAAAVGLVDQEFFCQNCNFTWKPLPHPAPPAQDALS
jgi:hypothetical protein